MGLGWIKQAFRATRACAHTRQNDPDRICMLNHHFCWEGATQTGFIYRITATGGSQVEDASQHRTQRFTKDQSTK